MIKNNFATVQVAAKLLGVSTRTIQTWIKQGTFPHAHKLNPTLQNSAYRIPYTDLNHFMLKRNNPTLSVRV